MAFFKDAINLPIPMKTSFSSSHKWIMTALYLVTFLHYSALAMESDMATDTEWNKAKAKASGTDNNNSLRLAGVRGELIAHLLSSRYLSFERNGVSTEPVQTPSSREDPKLRENHHKWEILRSLECSLSSSSSSSGSGLNFEQLVSKRFFKDQQPSNNYGAHHPDHPHDQQAIAMEDKYAQEMHATARRAAEYLHYIKPPKPIPAKAIRISDDPNVYVMHGIRYTLTQDYVEEFLKAAVGTDNVYPFLTHFLDAVVCTRN